MNVKWGGNRIPIKFHQPNRNLSQWRGISRIKVMSSSSTSLSASVSTSGAAKHKQNNNIQH